MSVAEAVDWAAADTPTLSSLAVCELLGVTYRQLDYVVRRVPELASMDTMAGGSGSRRRWDLPTIARLYVAERLADAVHHLNDEAKGASQRVAAARATMRGPTPPQRAFAILDPDGDVHYRSTLPADMPVGPVGLVVRYDMWSTEAAEPTEVVR